MPSSFCTRCGSELLGGICPNCTSVINTYNPANPVYSSNGQRGASPVQSTPPTTPPASAPSETPGRPASPAQLVTPPRPMPPVQPVQPVIPEAQSSPAAGKNGSSAAFIIISVILGIIAIGGIVFGLIEYGRASDAEKNAESDLQQKDSELFDANSEIDRLKSELEDCEDKIAGYKPKAEYYDAIKAACDNGKPGYANEKFYTDRGVMFIKSTETGGQKLTLHVEYSGSVHCEVKTGSVSASFDSSTRTDNTATLTVKPKSEGVSTLHFYNDLNNYSFDVIVVVY